MAGQRALSFRGERVLGGEGSTGAEREAGKRGCRGASKVVLQGSCLRNQGSATSFLFRIVSHAGPRNSDESPVRRRDKGEKAKVGGGELSEKKQKRKEGKEERVYHRTHVFYGLPRTRRLGGGRK